MNKVLLTLKDYIYLISINGFFLPRTNPFFSLNETEKWLEDKDLINSNYRVKVFKVPTKSYLSTVVYNQLNGIKLIKEYGK